MTHPISFCSFLTLILISCGGNDDLTSITPNTDKYIITIPEGLSELPIELTTNLTKEKVALGRMLFFDPILSKDSTVSCSSCHSPATGFNDNESLAVGIDGLLSPRSSMSLLNVAYSQSLNWDGSETELPTQAITPITTSHEMAANFPMLIERLKTNPTYSAAFTSAFQLSDVDNISRDHILTSLAQYETTLVSANSKFDQITFQGKAINFTESEDRGFNMFFDHFGGLNDLPDAECGHCHNQPFFGSNSFFNNGLDEALDLNDFTDKGRGAVTGEEKDNGKFKAPSLRNIALTAPYMHDGRFNTLEEVVAHYSSGGHYADNKDVLIQKLDLSPQQQTDIVNFLKTLTDTSYLTNEHFQSPF